MKPANCEFPGNAVCFNILFPLGHILTFSLALYSLAFLLLYPISVYWLLYLLFICYFTYHQI
jgi:hypothetical protein